MEKKEKKYYKYLDIIRIMSMIAVVAMHIIAGSLRENFYTLEWHIFNIINIILGFAVPAFFMISGALCISNDRAYDIKYVLKNRVLKILIPLISWSLINLGWLFINSEGMRKNVLSSIIRILYDSLKEPIAIHLWFLYAIILVYLLLPFIKCIVDKSEKNIKRYMLVLWLILSPGIVTVTQILRFWKPDVLLVGYDFNLNFVNGYLGCFILGYYLSKIDIKWVEEKIGIYKLLLIWLINIMIVAILTTLYSKRFDNYFEGIQIYNGIFANINAACLFMFVRLISYKKENNEKQNDDKESCNIFNKISIILSWIKEKIFLFLKNSTFGIYLMHNIAIQLLMTKMRLVTNLDKINYILVILLICGTITNILSKVPIVSYLFFGVKAKFKNK